MLQVKNISKVYKTGSLVQQALDGVSLSLRDNEFVAILGQSGSGKTTLLNIIGGLDRYDEGDLIINGISTKKYTDRDWDAFRNHTVGFVFQSYNLIPHQTVLANVELALTIGGISRREKTRRAKDALIKVGLGDHMHKKPSQLSGGQMQRVAIARALVNDPDILLADEPTGALDSDTSIQVMDLLKEVAEDRLVVMVTHNPELAERYATRIVRLKDGHIISDSDPVPEAAGEEAVHKTMGRTSMSFLTALSLSFNNLRTKLTRTILVAFAGSIGIIGIAMILSMSNGVNNYIHDIEENTLQGYPLQITDATFDMTSFYTSMMASSAGGTASSDTVNDTGKVSEMSIVTQMFSNVGSNDLKSLKKYIESGKTDIKDNVKAIEYDYGVTPQIFTYAKGKVRQVLPNTLGFAAMGMNVSSFTTLGSTFGSFHPMPDNDELFKEQYDLKAGRWPDSWNEMVIVLTSDGQISDLALYMLGKKDITKLDAIVKAFAEGTASESDVTNGEYDYEDFLGQTFTLINNADMYSWDKDYSVWKDMSGDEKYMSALMERSEKLTIVGIVQPGEDTDVQILEMGINYPASLVTHIVEQSAGKKIVIDQLRRPETDVFTGVKFGEESDKSGFDMNNLFSIDEQAISEVFNFDMKDVDMSALSKMDFSDIDMSNIDLSSMDFSSSIDADALASAMPSLDESTVRELLSGVKITVTEEEMRELFTTLLNGYIDYIKTDPSTDYTRLGEAMEQYFQSEDAREVLRADMEKIISENTKYIITADQLSDIMKEVMEGYPEFAEQYSDTDTEQAILIAAYFQTQEVRDLISQKAKELRDQLAKMLISQEQVNMIALDLLEDYQRYAQENNLPDPSKLTDSVAGYISSEEAQSVIIDGVTKAVDTSELEAKATEMLSGFTAAIGVQIGNMMTEAVGQITEPLTKSITSGMEKMMTGLTDSFADMFKFEPEKLAEAFSMNMDAEELQNLLSSLLNTEQSSYKSNLKKLGWADMADPSTITIYATDFDGKQRVKAIIDEYNDIQRAAGRDEQVIAYTDVADALINSVTDIVNAVSYVLIAFVGVSLVVSSIMIGVITYISVLERSKEIGILRAIGASKRNISEVFNAETFIIGALAGVFGIAITALLIIPTNIILLKLTNQSNIKAILPPAAAVILILLSIVLTLIGGIIPSRKAARRDPVAALRSE